MLVIFRSIISFRRNYLNILRCFRECFGYLNIFLLIFCNMFCYTGFFGNEKGLFKNFMRLIFLDLMVGDGMGLLI